MTYLLLVRLNLKLSLLYYGTMIYVLRVGCVHEKYLVQSKIVFEGEITE